MLTGARRPALLAALGYGATCVASVENDQLKAAKAINLVFHTMAACSRMGWIGAEYHEPRVVPCDATTMKVRTAAGAAAQCAALCWPWWLAG
jgi:hypothetical protein